MRQFLFPPLVLAAGIFFLTSCKNDPTTGATRVDGQVVERQGHRPVGDGIVQVYRASSSVGNV